MNTLGHRAFLAGRLCCLVVFFGLAAMLGGCAESQAAEPETVYFVAGVPRLPGGSDGQRVSIESAKGVCNALGAELATDVEAAAQACSDEESAYGWSCWTGAHVDGFPLAASHVPGGLVFPVDVPDHRAFPVCVVTIQ